MTIKHYREVIDNILYDTENATWLLDEWDKDDHFSHGYAYFKTKKGRYFFADVYVRVQCQDISNVLSDSGYEIIRKYNWIKPITEEQYKETLSRTNFDKYVSIYGEPDIA